MKIYDVSRLPSSIALGWDGENNWRPIAFDCSALLAGHPDGVVTLWLLPKGETQAFPVTLSRDGNTVVWTPLNEEMTAERGQLQIVVQDGTDVGKSKVIDYTVHDSLVGGADHPAETPSWAVQVVADVTEAAGHYPRIVDGNWYVWDIVQQEWIDTGVAAGGGDIDPEEIAEAVAEYLEEHPIEVTETDPKAVHFDEAQNLSTEQKAQARDNMDALGLSELSGAINTALDQAKASGEFDGAPGAPGTSPTVSVVTITGGHRITIVSASGTHSFDVMDGDDYVLTNQDKADIAALVDLRSYQTKAITDAGGYYTTDTVEGALQEIGAELASGGSGLPDTTSASAGDFLRLDSNKNAVWETVPTVMGASIPLGN